MALRDVDGVHLRDTLRTHAGDPVGFGGCIRGSPSSWHQRWWRVAFRRTPPSPDRILLPSSIVLLPSIDCPDAPRGACHPLCPHFHSAAFRRCRRLQKKPSCRLQRQRRCSNMNSPRSQPSCRREAALAAGSFHVHNRTCHLVPAHYHVSTDMCVGEISTSCGNGQRGSRRSHPTSHLPRRRRQSVAHAW